MAFLLLRPVEAAPYGEGSYGEAAYNVGPTPPSSGENTGQTGATNSAPANNSPASAPSCDAPKPSSVPDLFQINAKGESVTLYFAPVPENRDRYFVSFSSNQAAEEHGFEFLSNSNGVVAVSVNQLQKNTTYYFKVRAGNGCMPGDWSNILSIKNGQRFPSYRWSSLPRVITTAYTNRANPSIIQRVSDNAKALETKDNQPQAPKTETIPPASGDEIKASPTNTPAVTLPARQPIVPKDQSPSLLDRMVNFVLRIIGR